MCNAAYTAIKHLLFTQSQVMEMSVMHSFYEATFQKFASQLDGKKGVTIHSYPSAIGRKDKLVSKPPTKVTAHLITPTNI